MEWVRCACGRCESVTALQVGMRAVQNTRQVVLQRWERKKGGGEGDRPRREMRYVGMGQVGKAIMETSERKRQMARQAMQGQVP